MYRREFRKIIRSAKKNFLKVLKLKKRKKEKLMQRRRETKTLNGSENFISAKSKSKMSSVPAMEPALYK